MSVMRRVTMLVAIAAVIVTGSPRVWAEHLRFELTLESVRGKAQSDTDRSMPIMDVKRDEPLVLEVVVTNVYPHKIRKDTTLHYWISRQADDATPRTIDQSAPSRNRDGEATADPKALPLDGHLLVNFKPQGMAGLHQKLRMHDPGTYLVRVQSEHSGSDHEHYSQMILHVH